MRLSSIAVSASDRMMTYVNESCPSGVAPVIPRPLKNNASASCVGKPEQITTSSSASFEPKDLFLEGPIEVVSDVDLSDSPGFVVESNSVTVAL